MFAAGMFFEEYAEDKTKKASVNMLCAKHARWSQRRVRLTHGSLTPYPKEVTSTVKR